MSSGTKTSTESPSMSRTFHWRVTCVHVSDQRTSCAILNFMQKLNKETLLLFPRVLELTAIFEMVNSFMVSCCEELHTSC